MSVNEFELIARYFTGRQDTDHNVILGIGDDAAVVNVPPGQQLVVTADTLNEGIHFPAGTGAADIAHKALAVNLSDLAAMGASPAFFTLSLCMPLADEVWLAEFSRGLFALATASDIRLIGGDTTRGPLSIAITALGLVSTGTAISRGGARAGHAVYVSGSVGDGAIGLRIAQGELTMNGEDNDYFLTRLHRPSPRIRLGTMLAAHVSAMIDVSDGLLADLDKLATASGLGARVEVSAVPVSARAEAYLSHAELLHMALAGGDDYELCFTVAPDREAALLQQLQGFSVPVTRIGVMTATAGVECVHADGQVYHPARRGYDHFHH